MFVLHECENSGKEESKAGLGHHSARSLRHKGCITLTKEIFEEERRDEAKVRESTLADVVELEHRDYGIDSG